jgi:hypothetical protein
MAKTIAELVREIEAEKRSVNAAAGKLREAFKRLASAVERERERAQGALDKLDEETLEAGEVTAVQAARARILSAEISRLENEVSVPDGADIADAIRQLLTDDAKIRGL